MPRTPNNDRPTLRLRADVFREMCVSRGLVTDVARAAAIGVSRAQVIRAMNGDSAPGPEFIAAVLTRFPGRVFTDFFAVTSS